ncbi:alginate O-acetyltransferase AlgX-related protein [Amycolatopsis nigrescens]|uniref:alginate O-acetyltransferase AlgX-related protein n=1 Tax=Amycolatopsis nigrescens TaxID=381445 RepID=UPI00038185FE|nr:hypothetical protein [Amycolatopsis nigrescens]
METGSLPRPPAEGGLPPTHEAWLPNEHNLYRPRHSPRQRTALTCALVFFLAPTLAFVLGVRPAAFENRALHGFPSLGDGWGFFTGLNGWGTDHLALREAAVHAADGISTGVFGDPPGAARGTPPGGPAGIGPQGTGGQDPTAPKITFPQVIPGKDGWLYYGEDFNARCNPVMDVDHVVRALQKLRAAVESSGRRFEVMIAPDKSTMVPEHLPDSYPGKDCAKARSAEFWQRVPREAPAIDLRTEVTQTTQRVGHQLYDPNDTHWNFEGGLTMAKVLAERLAPGSTASWQVAPLPGLRPWPADLARMLGRTEERQLQGYTLAPDGTTDRARYLISDFMTPIRVTHPSSQRSPGTIGGKVGVLADSFSQFATPFLTASCQDLMIVHNETMAQAPPDQIAELLVDRDVVAVEFVERSVTGGSTPMLRDSVIDAIGSVLARNPR